MSESPRPALGRPTAAEIAEIKRLSHRLQWGGRVMRPEPTDAGEEATDTEAVA